MIFGIRGAKPKNPLDSEVLGTFNFTDYGLSYATAAELEALRVSFNMPVFKIEADQPQSQSCRVTMRIRSQQINCLVTFSLRRIIIMKKVHLRRKKCLGVFADLRARWIIAKKILSCGKIHFMVCEIASSDFCHARGRGRSKSGLLPSASPFLPSLSSVHLPQSSPIFRRDHNWKRHPPFRISERSY